MRLHVETLLSGYPSHARERIWVAFVAGVRIGRNLEPDRIPGRLNFDAPEFSWIDSSDPGARNGEHGPGAEPEDDGVARAIVPYGENSRRSPVVRTGSADGAIDLDVRRASVSSVAGKVEGFSSLERSLVFGRALEADVDEDLSTQIPYAW